MHKYTDEQIKKALKYCEISGRQYCDTLCPLFYSGAGSISDCRQELRISALDLINRQEAKIERLMKENAVLVEDNHILATEYVEQCTAKAKSEAIKEFAERLKNKASPYPYYQYGLEYAVSVENIDNLVEELESESNESV